MRKKICLDAFNNHCSHHHCRHYGLHDEFETHKDKKGYIVRGCDQDIHKGTHTECTPCIDVEVKS